MEGKKRRKQPEVSGSPERERFNYISNSKKAVKACKAQEENEIQIFFENLTH